MYFLKLLMAQIADITGIFYFPVLKLGRIISVTFNAFMTGIALSVFHRIMHIFVFENGGMTL
jgi:hypothetical protein